MGTWGANLYDSDAALDLKNCIAQLSRFPFDGERILALVLAQFGAFSLADEDGAAMWLVLADQFEKRGLFSQQVLDFALQSINEKLIENAWPQLTARQAAKQRAELDTLLARLQSPRPLRKQPSNAKPPTPVLLQGEVYAFPTYGGQVPNAWVKENPLCSPASDGWGALLVVAHGRAYDWLPWCALASITVAPDRRPTLDDVRHANLLLHLQTEGATICIPKAVHAARLRLEKIGILQLDQTRASQVISTWCSIESAVAMEWSIGTACFGMHFPTIAKLPVGCPVQDLLE
ncbi:hypothetical protein SAMN02745857_00932 [Andreprevotia lacus DSM 23236]|jgi:hypothetical protein|uniref:DUF4259 domain-containing protein n=1 Tax=Andreprevotia lacus DSM 23236 TaxID=1121001 RepID=A0A1W1X8X5_9NEIS|nr:hypothetical protein [Andreprevotia lacus]SMC20386.1 hypothetical protein SAMN02745857_00932 [Andreprevotia lacus DSM 23236]